MSAAGFLLAGFGAGLVLNFALVGDLSGDFVAIVFGLALAATGFFLTTDTFLATGVFLACAFGFMMATFLAAVGALLVATGFAGSVLSDGLAFFRCLTLSIRKSSRRPALVAAAIQPGAFP